MRLFLQIVAIFAFALAGSNFTHAAELQGADHHKVVYEVSDHAHALGGHDHSHDPASSDAFMHCGATAVLLTASHLLSVEPADAIFEYKPPTALMTLLVQYDLPPPRT